MLFPWETAEIEAKVLICSLERPLGSAVKSHSRKRLPQWVEPRGLKVGRTAMVVFIRKTSMRSGSNKGGQEGSAGFHGSWGTAEGGATKGDKEQTLGTKMVA